MLDLNQKVYHIRSRSLSPSATRGNKYLSEESKSRSLRSGKKNKYLLPVDLVDDALVESEIRYEFELHDASNFNYRVSGSAAPPLEMVNPRLPVVRSSFDSIRSVD